MYRANYFQRSPFNNSFLETYSRKLRKLYAGVLVLFLLFPIVIDAQSERSGHQSYGVFAGFGISEHKIVDRYQLFYLGGDFSWSLGKAIKKDFVSFYLEPQFNFVSAENRLDFEFGLNGGLRNYIRINPGFYFYQMIGSGPHYISANIKKQAKGFIFSNNFSIGVFKSINKKSLFLNLQFRFRHISNAGIKEPNEGVNSYNLIIGLSKMK